MMRSLRRDLPTPADATPNLAPMVDVIMVILVFFMLGASIDAFREGALRTELDPRSGPGAQAAVEILPTVQVGLGYVDDQICRIFVMGRPLTQTSATAAAGAAGAAAPAATQFDDLRATLIGRIAAGADPLGPVVLAAEAPVPWELVVRAMDAVLAAGFRNVQFAVNLGR